MLLRMTKRPNKGFTLPEVILMVAVMAILTTMAFPDIVSFFRRQKIEEEKQVQNEIRKAMEAYDNENLELPPQASWSQDLSHFTNLADTGIAKDVWGHPRVYTVYSEDKVYREGVVTFYYASVASNGENNVFESGTWNDVGAYGQYAAQVDDIVTKFTDQETKQKRYDETVTRMERIIAALDRYAQAQYNNAVLNNEPNYDTKVFYPPSSADVPPANGYGNAVAADTSAIVGGAVQGGDIDSMKGLMRLLGLPEDHCCNALAPASAPEAFYYAANPQRVNAAGGCVGGSTMPPFVPPKISLSPLC
ncbi:MAG: prepilin-type N-terminal cleavage/methylation domain-containing protein [Proteobacteria bacterium]|nr:prepilin-type N-terminal cleavage/methylation domain-containing protein [Pseudomonadota bacterium]